MSLTIHADMSGLANLIDTLATDVEAAVRPAAQAGAQVLYDEVKKNVAGIGKVSGNLAASIYQAFSHDNSGKGYATYHVSWNHKKAPHGHLIENGHVRAFKSYIDKNGRWRTKIRNDVLAKMRAGQRVTKPSRSASFAEKAMFYEALPAPVHVSAKSFVRNAQSKSGAALAAAETELLRHLFEGPLRNRE